MVPVPAGGAPVVPHGAGARQGLMGGVGSGHPTHGRGSAGPEGSGLEGEEGQVSWQAWNRLQAGVWRRLVVGIPVVVGPVAWPRGGYSGVVWVWGLEVGVAEGRVSRLV
jgi:hypothetical protein